jgi:hypothetical protein
MSTQDEQIDKAVSDAKLAANRANALKSCGPRTPEGKAISRLNAVKHGLYAETVVIPGEDGELFDSRFDTWSRDLNPLASPAADYMVAQLVRKSIRLDRCHQVHDANVAELARTALQVRASERAGRVETLTRLLDVDRDTAVRGLRETPEGCDLLIKEWVHLTIALVEPAAWDDDDAIAASVLQGRYRSIAGNTPDPLVPPTDAVLLHRNAAAKLLADSGPPPPPWDLRYRAPAPTEADRARVVDLELAAILAKDVLRKTIDRELAGLRTRRLEVEENDRLELAGASVRARFDSTERGRLMHRHELDLERGLNRGIKVLRDMGRSKAQGDAEKVFVSDRPWESVALSQIGLKLAWAG